MGTEPKAAKENRSSFKDWAMLVLAIYSSLWTSWAFMFKEILGPAKKSSSLDVRATMENIGEREDKCLIRVTIETNNPTDREIYVPAYWFTVVGVELEPLREPPPKHDASVTSSETKFSNVSNREIVAQYKLASVSAPGAAAWWDPKNNTRNSEVFSVPKDKFDYLKLTVQWFTTRFGKDIAGVTWSADENGEWHAIPTLVESAGADLVAWSEKTASGYNWYETTIPLLAQDRLEQRE